jgi:two-component system, NarL family, sensor histidine kinase UhpB
MSRSAVLSLMERAWPRATWQKRASRRKGPALLFSFGRAAAPKARRRVLSLIVLAAVIPVLIFGGSVAFFMADRSRDEARRSALATTEGVAQKVAAELSKELDVAAALGASTDLDRDDLALFYRDALRISAARPLWETVSLADATGKPLVNLLRPLGGPLPPDPDPVTLREVLANRRPAIGGIGPVGPISGKRLVPLRVPVERNGELLDVLTVWLNPVSISDILRSAGAPADWVGAILDRDGRIVARTSGEETELGRKATLETLRSIGEAAGGFYVGRTHEGLEVETAFRRLPMENGWTVLFGIPREALNAPVSQSLVLLVVVGLGSLALSTVLGTIVARDLAHRRELEEERAALALRLSEAKEMVAVEAAELGTWRWSKRDQQVVCSGRTARLLGIQVSSTRGQEHIWTSEQFFAAIQPFDRPMVEKALGECRANRGIDVEFRAAGGSPEGRWLRLTGRIVGREGLDASLIHGVLADVDDRHRAEAERRDLARRLAEAQEAERRRISRELHDQVGQTVTGLSLGLKTLEKRLTAEAARSDVRWLLGLAREVGRDIHRASCDLRPTALDDLGLQRALAALASDLSLRHGIAIDVQAVGPIGRLGSVVETAIYRSIQEALTNVLKHAGARSVGIVLERRTADLRVVVDDDGCGFDPEDTSRLARPEGAPIGISGMRERLSLIGGVLTIESAPGAGASVFIQVPITERSDTHA